MLGQNMTGISEFLVEIDINVPADIAPETLADLRAAEAARAEELASSGALARIWRPSRAVGRGDRWANVGLWRAESRDQLESLLLTLPLGPYMTFEIVGLSEHPTDPGPAREAKAEPSAPVITGTTKVCFVIADPVAHLRTPSGLNALWAASGADIVSVAANVTPADLMPFLEGMRANRSAAGAVVTVPHKQSVVRLCDDLGPNARVVGAVNAIRRDASGRLIGETFDGLGFLAGLRKMGIHPEGMHVLLGGAGGAASAVAAALLQAGVEHLDVVNRTEARAHELADRLRDAFPKVDIRIGAHRAGLADLAINATSSGMADSDHPFIDVGVLSPSAIAADVVMSSQLTPFLRAAASRGIQTHEGVHMLAGQLQLIAEYLE